MAPCSIFRMPTGASRRSKKAVALAPGHVPALVSLSAISLKREDAKAALEYGERAVKAGPGDFSTHIVLGRALLASEEPARAATELEQAIKLAPARSGSALQSGHRVQPPGPERRRRPRAGRIQTARAPWREIGPMKHLISTALIVAAALARLARSSSPPSKPTSMKSCSISSFATRRASRLPTSSPTDITVTDNGVKQTLLSFRLVRGSEAVSATGASMPLDPLRQIRLVTLAFEPLAAPDQRKLARTAALDLIKGDQGTNVFYSVVVIDTRLLVLQHFTKDHDALAKAIERATEGVERAAAELPSRMPSWPS